jgi:hypothetical protein
LTERTMGMNVPFIVPQGLSGIVETYGDVRAYITPDGKGLRPEWEINHLAFARLPDVLQIGWESERKLIRRFRCHVRAVPKFEAAFQEVKDAGLWRLLHTFDGCFNFRPVRGTTGKISTHAWGISVDLNAASNPLGKPGDMDIRIVEVFEKHGFVWGGRWSRRDDQHFQLAEGY